MISFFVGGVLWIFIAAVITAMIANSKGRSAFLWFLYGLIIWPIAMVHALLLNKNVSMGSQQSKEDWKQNPEGPRRCPNSDCERIVHGVQENCPYCKTPMDGAKHSCPKCQNLMYTNLTICSVCEYDLEADPEKYLSDERECPQCAELIKKKAQKCKHCGSDVEPVAA